MPFFLVSYAQALQQSGQPPARGFQAVSGSGLEEVPWDVAQGVKQRAAVLPEIARLVLGAAAVVGRRVSRDLLVAAIVQPQEAVLTGLEGACRARLLLEDGEDAYIFAHDLIREVLEADLGAARRAQLHGRVADALAGEPGTAAPELLAYHYVRAGLSDRAAHYLEMAGDHAASQYANKVAEEYYREALERVDRDDDLTRLREKLGLLMFRIGKYDATLALLEPAAAAYRAAGDWAGLVRVTALIGWACAGRGTAPEGIESIRALLQQLDRHTAAQTRGELYCALGMCLCNNGQYEEALAACERAIDLVSGSDVDRTGILAEWLRIYLLMLLGRLEAARQAGRETLPRTETLGDWLCLSAGHRSLAELHVLCGALDTAQEHVTRSLASATAFGAPGQISLALTSRGWIARLRGQWDAARTALEQALALGRQLDGQLPAAYALIDIASLCLAEEDLAAAAAAGEEALALAQGAGDREALRCSSAVLAELEILEGRPGAARARLVPLLDRPGLEEYVVTMFLPVLALAHLELGQVDVAAGTVAKALARARREGMRLVLVDALRVQALIDLRRERWDEAERSLEEGLSIARSIPYPHAEARLLEVIERGHALRARSEVGPASGAAGLALP
jgi:tetratricopeptide (TPR) repeat protein